MRVGIVATLFDKVQHAYGWSDEQVLNLTLRRFVQIKESIEQREAFAKWEQYKVLEWQTKSITSFISNTVEDNDARSELVKASQSLTLLGGGRADTNTSKVNSPKTFKTKDGKIVQPHELKNYEYDEIDHTEEERSRVENARKMNSGKSLMQLGSMLSGR